MKDDLIRIGVQKMQNYMKTHLNEKITLKALAKEAGYSQYYAARLFKTYTGKSPFEYLRALRLSEAALRLRDSDDKIIDVAFDFVFDSHEGFTRAFTKLFGLAPKKYSLQPIPIPLFMSYPIKNKEREAISMSKDTQTVFVQVVERPKRKLILKRAIKSKDYFEYCEEVSSDVWGILVSVKEALYEPVGLWLPENIRPKGTSEYVQGVEVADDYCGVIPEGFEIIDLEAVQMMIFQGEPYDDEDFENAILNLWELMKKYDPSLYGFKWADEKAPRFQLEPQGYRGYIEGRPVVKL